MLSDSLLLPECVYRPGSFSGLMLLYESNYLKLHGLIGDLDTNTTHWISRARRDSDLILERTRAEPYTTSLSMTYWLRDSEGIEIKDPYMSIRVYHDASLVEGLTCRASHRHHRLREIGSSHTRELSRRWRVNMMLNKWLDYLLESGHGFV